MAAPVASTAAAAVSASSPAAPPSAVLRLHAIMRARFREAPMLPAHLMPDRQASVQAALLHTTRANNFPPANSEQQRYGPDELQYNALQVGVSLQPQDALSKVPGRLHPSLFSPFVALRAAIHDDRQQQWQGGTAPCEVRMSDHICTKIGQHTQLGVYAKRDIKAGEYIDHYADSVGAASQIYSSTWVRKVPGADFITDGAPLAWLYTRYISTTEAGLQDMRDLPASAFQPLASAGDKVMQRFLELPMGCIINSPSSEDGAGKANVRSQLKTYKTCGYGQYTRVIASRDISRGEELLMMYHNNEENYIRGGLMLQLDPFPPAVLLYNCRAARQFTSGDVIGWLWGMLATHEQWLDMTGQPPRDSHEVAINGGREQHQHAHAAENFLQAVRLGIWRCLPIRTRKDSNETNLSRLIVSERCPMAHLGVAMPGSREANAMLPSGDAVTLQLDDPATSFRGLAVHATRDIKQGESILIDLGWTAAAFNERAQAAAASAASSSASAAATTASSPTSYIDSPCVKRRKEGQQKQWDNLKQFVHNNLAAYEKFPYAPFTASANSDLSSAHLALGPSLVHSSLLGVRLKPASHTDRFASARQTARCCSCLCMRIARLGSSRCLVFVFLIL